MASKFEISDTHNWSLQSVTGSAKLGMFVTFHFIASAYTVIYITKLDNYAYSLPSLATVKWFTF